MDGTNESKTWIDSTASWQSYSGYILGLASNNSLTILKGRNGKEKVQLFQDNVPQLKRMQVKGNSYFNNGIEKWNDVHKPCNTFSGN